MAPRTTLFAVALSLVSTPAFAQFTFSPPGDLVSGSGDGRKDYKVYAPTIRFPIESAPAFPNSQVYGKGGSQGPAGSQCDAANFSYPWHDNYCEKRSWDMPLCPAGIGHQGQDIRAASCEGGKYWAVAVVDGTITSVGSYSVYLTAADGTRYDYLHMSNVQVATGQKVSKGQHVGKVSNVFDGTPTSVHLHFNVHEFVSGVGSVYVPPYMSLVGAYQDLVGKALDATLVSTSSTAKKDGSGKADFTVCPEEKLDFSITLENAGTARWVDLGADGNLSGERVRLTVPDDATPDPLTDKLRVLLDAATNGDVRPASWGAGGEKCTTAKCRQTTFKIAATAPKKVGIVTTSWRLRDYSPAWQDPLAFGPKVTLKFAVVACSGSDAGAGGAIGEGGAGGEAGVAGMAGVAGEGSGPTGGSGGTPSGNGGVTSPSKKTDAASDGGCAVVDSRASRGFASAWALVALAFGLRRRRQAIPSTRS